MANVSTGVAAKAAGLTEPELAALQDSGQMAKPVNFAALAAAIGLNGAKLEGIANGWLPAEKDLSRWPGLRIFTSAGDDLTVNCYLVWDEVTRNAALFDTGFNLQPISETIAAERLQLRHIFITHSHHDHVAALADFRAAFPQAKLHTHSKRALMEHRNKPNEIVHLGGLRVTHRETPGHAADGVTYLIGNWQDDAPHVAIVGDAIFAGSMGRGNDSWELARQKVREQILSLPGDTLLCPGHGPLTTVVEEKAHNPFF